MSNRCKNDIIVAILQTTDGGEIKTRIQAKCYLSYPQLMRYLEDLMMVGAIVHVNGQYYTTEKGRTILEHSKIMDDLMTIPVLRA